MTEDELVNYIREVTISVMDINDNLIYPFTWLSEEIHQGKSPLKLNSAHFIIAKVLTRNRQVIDIRKREKFDVYIIGDFKKSFNPILRVAEAFASFYIEWGVLPNIIPLPKTTILKNERLLLKLKNGLLLYERR